MARSIGKGLAAGLAGGLAGAWVMNQFQTVWSRIADGAAPQSSGGRHDGRDWQERNEDENANEALANRFAETAIDRDLTKSELAIAAPAVHYGFGAAMGAVYGAITERSSRKPPLTGAAWGAALWAVADEIAVPMFHLSKPGTDYPAEVHVQALAAHLVYGVTAELVQMGIRSVI
jgi:hypothetical protein